MNEKILVVEDERGLRRILCDNLKFDGFVAIPAGSGKEAIEQADREKPRLAIIDVGLPDIDGWEVLRRLRALPIGNRIDAIMLSGNFGDEVNGLPPGIESRNLVAKPYEYSTLVDLIRSMLSGA